MKISSTKKAAILATVLGGFMLSASAEAAKLGVVTASDYSTSHMGAIEGSYIDSDKISAIKSVITGLNRDPAVYNTVDPITGESSIYIRQYNYSTTNLQNSYAFNGQDWSNKVAGNTSGAVNAHDVARYNDFVYVASYDEGTIGVAQITDTVISDKTAFTRNIKEDLKTYAGLTFDSKAQLHGEGVVIVDGNLYVIANCNPQGGYDPYSPSYLIKYAIKEDGRLSYDGYTTMGKNTDSVSLNVYNNYMLATAIGGYQFYGAENSNADTSLNYAELDPETKRFVRNGNGAITLPENLLTVRDGKTIPKSEFRSLKVLPNGTAYVMTYNIGKAGKNVDVTVYQTTISNLLSKTPQNWKVVFEQKAAPGWFGRLDAEYNTKRLWVQVGNKLHIFTDGEIDDNHKVFGTGDFATNDMYEELYTWDIIGTNVIPEGNLVKLNVQRNIAADKIEANKKAPKWNSDYTNVNQRLENVSGSVNIEGVTNPLIHLDGTVEGNKTNNVLAGIYAEGVNTSVISNNGLQIQVQNNIASPVGIYAGNGGSVKYYGSNSELNIITKTMKDGNTLTNAVWLDPSVNGGEAITLQSASTNITMEGGYGGNGVAIQKTDRWGEDSKASTQGGKITITGDLNIKGKDNGTWGIEANPTNVLSRFNNAGILVDVNNSSVTVQGNVDMDVYGNGVTVTGDNSTVTLQKGGTITVPKGTEYGYYALAAYDGTINMNAKGEANTVKLDGDIFVTSEGIVNLGLANEYSYLKGIIDNGGTANLTLKNGAVWTNVANNKRYIQDNEDVGTTDQRSHVTKLTGGKTFDDAGTIVQTANSKLLYIDNLDGAVKINYTGQDVTDTNPETKLNNGVTIDKAVEGSQIALFTSNAGIKTDDETSVNAVLKALANKLYYNAYVTGERNLTGVAVGMNEGLTASSVTKQANIKFIEATGQGSLSGSASEGTGINPDTGKEESPKQDEDENKPNEDDDVGGTPEEDDGGRLEEPFTPVAHPNSNTAATNVPTWNDNPTKTEAIQYTGTKNLTLNAGEIISVVNNANVGEDILAATYNTKQQGVDKFKITGDGSLQIQAESDTVKPVAIYVEGYQTTLQVNKDGTNKAGTINIITKTNADDMRTNAIWMAALGGKVSEKLTISAADVNINMIGGYGGNGVAITKSDSFTPVVYEEKIIFSGNLNIKGTDANGNADWGIGANKLNALGKENSSGIYVNVDEADVEIGGNANIDVYGNGVTVDAAKSASVTIKKGGTITVPKGTDYAYYTLAAYGGTINMNSGAGANDVVLNGDVLATEGATINLGLATSTSQLNGIIDNGGTVNLTLKNGAIWTNEAQNERYKFDNKEITGGGRSIVTNLTGGSSIENAGSIIQTANSDNLYVGYLNGAIKVTYNDFDANDPTKIYGGNVTINTAKEGSQIGLYTTNNGITAENVDEALNALANKLYYNEYVKGKRNLSAIAVGINEGLTSPEITKEIQFIETTGQGTITGEGTGANPDVREDAYAHGLLNNTAGKRINKSTIELDSDGHGITVDATGAVVDIKNGATITVPTGGEEKHYAINAKNGGVYMALADSYSSYNFSGSGNSKIDGDVYVGSNSFVNIGIKGADNYLNGAVDNDGAGEAKLILLNNATWTNASTNGKKGVTSKITNLGMESGAKIVQTADSGDIVIENFGGQYGWENSQSSMTGSAGYFQQSGEAKVYYTYDLDAPTVIKGGNIVINKVAYDSHIDMYENSPTYKQQVVDKASKITLCTNYSSSITKDNVQTVLNSLANKLYYLGYIYQTDEDGNVKFDSKGNPLHTDEKAALNAYVQINEGLVGSSITAELLQEAEILDSNGDVDSALDKVTYKDNSLNANIIFNGTTGQGSLTGELIDGTGFYEPDSNNNALLDENGAYARPIYGKTADDINYAHAGILKDGEYNFTDAVTVFNTYNKKIDGGAYHSAVGVAISAHSKGNVTNVNLNNNDLIITNTTTGSGASISAIDGGVVEINNAGNIIINENGHGPTAGIFANSGGEVYIDNAKTGGVVTIRTAAGGAGNDSAYKESGACLKTMNGVSDVRSKIVITGMVDLVADLNTCNNEAISSVASTIEVGGGNIQAINGAWAAIRAYGEFVSENASVVNVNVVKQKDADGNILKDPKDSNVDLIAGAGDNKTTIYGDFVTNGGMGTKGNISVGLGTADSYWIGNYGDTRGYGVTQGMEGEVNLYMKNGASWTGFTDGEMNVTMEGEGTTWLGYNVAERIADAMNNVNGGLTLTLKDGAVWQNAITTEQKIKVDGVDVVQDAKVYDFNGAGGFIDMTGNKTFIGKNSAYHAEGSNGVSFKNTSIVFNDTPQETGNLVITNYSGDTTVIYRRDTTDVTNILGGTTTIKSAAANSQITLSTDNSGIDMTNITQVETVLDNLADKLFYTGYIGKAENNLKGFVQIAEGLTTSSAGKYIGDVVFSEIDGQADYKNGSLSKPSTGEDDKEDNTGNENQGSTTDKEDTTIKVENITGGNIVGDKWADETAEDNIYKDLVGANKEGQAVIDLSKLDNDDSKDKVDIVKIETNEDASGTNIGISTAGSTKPVIFEAAGKSLSVTSEASGEAKGISATYADVEINGAGYVTIEAVSTNGSASAIYASGKDVTIESSETVKLIANGGAGAVLHAAAGSNVNIDGKVEIVDNKDKVAVEVANGATVNIGGGVIDAGDGTAIVITGTDSKVIANTDENGESKNKGLKVKGDIQIGEKPVTYSLRNRMMLLASGAQASGEFTFDGADDAWEGDYTGANDTTLILALKNCATWTGAKESNGVLDLTIESNGTWKNTSDKATTVTSMSGEGGFVEMSEGDLAIGTYNGDTTFIYQHNDKNEILGGDVTIKAAAENSIVTMRTNNIGTSDRDEVDRVLNALAEKLAYADYANNPSYLTGKVQIMEGMTGSSVTREGKIAFDKDGNGSLDKTVDVKVDYTGDYIYGDSETAMMKGAKSAMASTVMMWRSESNDLLQRMGDLRMATEEGGVWAKYYGGKYEMDAQKTKFNTSYSAYQAGYDKEVGDGWRVGLAVSHNDGNSTYDLGGKGDMTVTSLSVYGTKDYEDGRYLGLIVKGSSLKNEYEVYNNDGYKLEGDYKTWGTSVSAEYGKRIEKGNGFYFDPSVELTIGHVQGKSYTANSDLLAAYGQESTMQVEQDSYNSVVGRIGFGIGQKLDKASYYAKLALAHEFAGDFETTYTAEETKGTSISFGDTWCEMQLGGTAKLSDNSLVYATYERSFGGDVTEKWRIDAGLRFSF